MMPINQWSDHDLTSRTACITPDVMCMYPGNKVTHSNKNRNQPTREVKRVYVTEIYLINPLIDMRYTTMG